ncbi:MAG: glycosyltransferase [Segetibacter sp.]|nr:glycosyltransferase [Segetibacter sp.]
MAVVAFIMVIFLAGYAFLIENYRRWFLAIHPFTAPENANSAIRFSVIIPARNEEEIIATCLHSVLKQNYSAELFEVIVIDDHSTDKTAAIVQSLQKQYPNLRLIQLEKLLQGRLLNSYKKKAIEYAIEQSAGDWIVTTDADCKVPLNWLNSFNAFIHTRNSVLVAAPVKFTNVGSFVSVFQCLDFMTLQGITAASVHHNFHSMCNGANLAYNKRTFDEVGGFAGIDNIASGDDMLLMHKIFKKYPAHVNFILSGEAVVETLPMPTWKAFFNQRIRWASKADKYDDKRILWVLVFVYLFNLSFIVVPVLSIWYSPVLLIWLAMLGAKTLIELRFIYPVALFFKQRQLLWWFPLMQPFHILYTIIAGWLGKFGKYTWKGRTVK